MAQTTRLAKIRGHHSGDRHVSFLSFGHFAEQFMSLWLHTVAGYQIVVTGERRFVDALGIARPTFVMAVPVQWAGIADALSAAEGGREERLRAVGLDSVRLAIGTGAPLAAEVHTVLAAHGLKICEMYGMSESTGAATYNAPDIHRPGSVGQALPGSSIAIDDDGEIRIVGAVFQSPGYVDQPDATSSTFAADGIRTGDLGRLDEDGYLFITGRKKELLVMANGKKVHPGAIEARIQALDGVRHALVFGEGERSLVALLDIAPDARERIDAAMAALNLEVARHERIRSYDVVEPLTFEAGELTASSKVRRAVVAEKYRERLKELFARPAKS